MLTTFADVSTVRIMPAPTVAVAEASAALLGAIGNARTFDSRLVAYERAVRQAVTLDKKLRPPDMLEQLAPLDRAAGEAKRAAEDALLAAVDEARAAGASWAQLQPILRLQPHGIADTHMRWTLRNAGRARILYHEGDRRTFEVVNPTTMKLDAALKRVERAQLATEVHERGAEAVRNEMWRAVDLARASKWTFSEIAEIVELTESTLHRGHANWAARNHRTARVQSRPFDERRNEAMTALRGWAKENDGALPTGLKMWNDVPVGKKIRDFRYLQRRGRLDQETADELAELFGADWADPAPPGSAKHAERIIAGKDAGT